MTTKGLFNYSAADACGESPFNSDPSNLSNAFAFTIVRTSPASYEDKVCLSTGDLIAFLVSPHLLLGSTYSARLLREVRKGKAGSSGKQGRSEKAANAPR